MKIKIDDMDIEGTPEEIISYISLSKNKEKNVSALPVVFDRFNDKIEKSDNIVNTAFEYYKKGFSMYASLQKAGMKGHNNRLQKGLKLMILANGMKIVKFQSPKNKNMRPFRKLCSQDSILRKRGKFLISRVNTYMKYQNLSREEAFKRACEEWNDNRHLYHKKIVKSDIKDFPEILSDKTQNNLLQDVLKNIVANGTKMTFYNEGAMLGAETPEQWNLLLNSIVKKSAEITECFFAKGKFYIELIGKSTELRYKKS